MDVIRVFQVLMRRWAFVLPVVLLGVAASALAATTIPDEYSATGSLIVIDRSGGAGEVTPGVLAEALQDGAVRDAVAGQTGSATYSVSADDGGIIRIVARGDAAQQAADTANAVLTQIEPVLQARRELSGGATTSASVEVLNRATASSVVVTEEGLPSATASARLIGAGGTAVGGERASRLLAQALGSTAVREQVAASGGVPDYAVSTTRDLPTIGITAVASDSASASATVEIVGAQATAQLQELLALQGSAASVSVEPLAASGGVTVDSTGVLRSVVALLALTAALGVAVAFAAEGISEHRRNRAGHERQDGRAAAPVVVGRRRGAGSGTDLDGTSRTVVEPSRYEAFRPEHVPAGREQAAPDASDDLSKESDPFPDLSARSR